MSAPPPKAAVLRGEVERAVLAAAEKLGVEGIDTAGIVRQFTAAASPIRRCSAGAGKSSRAASRVIRRLTPTGSGQDLPANADAPRWRRSQATVMAYRSQSPVGLNSKLPTGGLLARGLPVTL